ncbi:MAG: hypothetical protein K0M40_00060 [Prolixibacteraceae bacterium]|nr:hypothetical protein [Prolixibacteraceae bacterium]
MKNENQRLEQFEQLWQSITPELIPQLDENFEEYAIKLTEFLILSLFESEYFEIGILNDNEASMISYDIYNSDKQLTLYYMANETWKIELHLEDYDGNERDYSSKLEADETQVIPVGLKNLMKETLEQGEARSVQAKSIK